MQSAFHRSPGNGGWYAQKQVNPSLVVCNQYIRRGNLCSRMPPRITDAQSIKPGSNMPSLHEFDGETLNAIAAYLETLE